MAGDDVTIAVTANSSQAIRAFRDVNGQLRDMRGRFVAEGGLMTRAMNQVSGSVESAGGSMGRLAPAVGQVGAAVGVSLLPALGAAAPLLAGFGAVGGAAALAMDGMKKQAKELKGPLEDWRKAAEKAVLPHTAKAIDSLKSAMKDLTPVIKTGGEVFGEVAESAAKFADSPAFKGALIKNVEMGSRFVKDFAGNMGTFTQSFLDFGTKSQPTVDALQNLVGGLVGKGLPGMFKGLETGVGGAAQTMDGLAYALNDKILPAFGEFAGAFSKATGPLFKEGLKVLGDGASYSLNLLSGGLKLAAPLLEDLSHGFRGVREFAAAVVPTLADTGRAVFEALIPFGEIENARGPLRRLADAIEENRGAIQEGARQFGGAVLTMVEAAVNAAPPVISAFRMLSLGALTALDGLVSGAATAFGWIPGIGDKLKGANTAFDNFKDAYLGSLETAEGKAEDFAASVAPKLAAGRLKLDISSWEAQIATAKGQMKSVPPEKRAALKAKIDELQAKVRQAKADLASLPTSRSVTITTFRKNTVRNIVEYQTRYLSGRSQHDIVGATGGLYTGKAFRYADGGPVRGPGTGTSDDVFAPWLSNGEFVMKAAAVQKYGEKFMQLVNDGQLNMPRFAKGGSVTKSERDARRSAAGELTLSYYGRMAGYKNPEIRNQLGSADSVSELVGSLNKWRGVIKATTHGVQEARLLKLFRDGGQNLIYHQKKLADVSKSLEKAKTKLDGLKDSASQLSSSVKSGILGSANITKAAGGEGHVTINTLMSEMIASRDKAQSFSGALKSLKAKGLSRDLIGQIADAGIEGGGLETAEAILGGGGREIKQLNLMQAQVGSYATSAGKTAADAMYGAGIKAAEGLVKGLKSKEDQIERHMLLLAKKMESAIKKALGIRSPSKVMEEVGSYTADGFALGITRNRSVMPAWASMLNAPRGGPLATKRAAVASGAPQVIHQTITLDGRVLAEQIFDPLRGEVRKRGGLRTTYPDDFRR
ncbi:hypothetical protein ACFPH6_19550 [Streptomyces xiangluensis]|uniref:Tape measure domain-containing protein n=1 Tax=Streptomyces xiangluensis TaxID=2665720 RepID=A0ABV8YU66_9ACTN